jgi:hypothetical protein
MFSTLSLLFQDIQCSPIQFKQMLMSGKYTDCPIVYDQTFWGQVVQQHMLSFYVEKIYILITHGHNLRPLFQTNEALVESLAEHYAFQKQSSYQTVESIRLLQCYKFIFKYIISGSTTEQNLFPKEEEQGDCQPVFKRQRVCS